MATNKSSQVSGNARVIAWDTLRYSLMWVYEDVPQLARGWVNVTTSHSWYLMRGKVAIHMPDGQTQEYGAGNWVMLPHSKLERTFSDDAYLISLNFQARWPDGNNLFPVSRLVAAEGEKFPGLITAARNLLTYVQKTFPDVQLFITTEHATAMEYLMLQRLLMDWIVEYTHLYTQMGMSIHALSPMDERIVQAREFIDQNIFSQVLSESVIAARVGVSVSHLNRLFSSQYGKTPRRYMEDRRIALAKRLLKGSDVSIKQLAYNMGFRQLSHFSSWFRRQAKMSPRAYRQYTLQYKDYSF
jgi:AraC-like DNA-binding protein